MVQQATTYGRVAENDHDDPMAHDQGLARQPGAGQPVTPRLLSEVLRNGVGPELTRRRWTFGLSLLGVAMGQVVGLYQMGIVKKLPSLPLELFDATRVDAADYAYKRMQTPDAPLMIINYGITAVLAAAGPRDRAKRTPWLPIALAAKAVYDLVTAVRLGVEEYRDTKHLCDYCQVATLASAASVALAVPEAMEAVSRLRGRGQEPLLA